MGKIISLCSCAGTKHVQCNPSPTATQSPVEIESVKRALMLWILTVGDFHAGIKYDHSKGTNFRYNWINPARIAQVPCGEICKDEEGGRSSA